MNHARNKRQIEPTADELNELFKTRDPNQIAGETLDDVLWTPGVIFKLAKHGASATELRVRQNGLFSLKSNVLKPWIIGAPPNARKTDAIAVKNGTGRPCTITIDPRDIEDARWAGSSKSTFGFVVTATVLDDEGMLRGATKIIVTPDPSVTRAQLLDAKKRQQSNDEMAAPAAE